MSENGKFRSKKTFFTQVSNTALRDCQLSLKAKGLYGLIQSYVTLENFVLYKNTLRKVCKEGEKAFESTWKELKTAGYLVQYKLQKTDGTFYYEYELLDESIPPKKEGVDNDMVEKDPMDKVPVGKGGIYNNTNINNTNINNTNKNTDSKSKISGKKVDRFNNFEQRDYDYDSLEKKLLGWEK